jgi:hypothetical protein
MQLKRAEPLIAQEWVNLYLRFVDGCLTVAAIKPKGGKETNVRTISGDDNNRSL